MSDRIVSYLRTAVPVLWGTLVAQLLAALAPYLPGDVYTSLADLLSSDLAQGLATAAVIAVWYVVWRRVEPYVPDWLSRIALGSALTPAYRLGSVYPVAAYNTDDTVLLKNGARVTIGATIMEPGADAPSYQVYYPSGTPGTVPEGDIARLISRAG